MRNRLLTIALLCGALALTAEPVRHLRLTDEPTLTLGGEFPGAQGQLDARNGHAKISYDLGKGAYVGLVTPAVLHQGTTALAFRVRPTCAKVRLFVRTTDSKGEQQMRRIRQSLPPREWTELTADLSRFEAHWGGPNEGRIHWPLTQVVIGVEGGEPRQGEVELSGLTVTTTAPESLMPSLRLSLLQDRFGALFEPDEAVTIRFRLQSCEPGRTLAAGDVRAVLRDWRGREIPGLALSPAPGQAREGVFAYRIEPAQFCGLAGAFQLTLQATPPGGGDALEASTWFGRLPGPRPRPLPWAGTHFHGGHGWGRGDFRFLDIISAVGYGAIREEFGWSGIERTKGEYRLSPNQLELARQLKERGILFNLLLTYGNPIYENPFDPQAFARWAAFMAESFKGLTSHFEIWNEPHNFGFRKRYGGDMTSEDSPWIREFVSFTRAASDAIRRVQPDAHIAVTAEDSWPTLATMLRLGIADSRNTISFHPYCHGQPRPERSFFFSDRGKAMRELSAAHGGARRYTITEMGWTTYQGPGEYLAIAGGYPRSSYVHQAQYIIRAYLSAKAHGVEYITQYDFKDDGPNRGYTEHNFGVVHEDYTPKPALLAAAWLCRLMEGAAYVDDLGTDSLVRLYQFRRPDGSSVVAAYVVEGTRRLSLPVAGAPEVRDLMGNRLEASVARGQLDITLDECPVYLTGLDTGKLARRLVVDAPALPVIAPIGLDSSFTVTCRNLTGRDAEAVTVTLAVDGQPLLPTTAVISQRLATGESLTLDIPLSTAAPTWNALADRSLAATVTCTVNGQSTACPLTIIPRRPLVARASGSLRRQGAAVIPLALENTTDTPVRARVTASLAGQPELRLTPADVTIPAHGAATAWLAPADPQASLTGTLLAHVDYGQRQTLRLKLPIRAAAIPAAPASIPLATEPRTFALPGPREVAPEDLSLGATATLSATPTGLRVVVDVTDDVFFQPFSNHGDAWRGDSVQLAVAPPEGNQRLEATFAKLAQGDRVSIDSRLAPGTQPADIAFTATRLPHQGDMRYDITLPWSALPGCRHGLRLSLLVNDNDGAERKGWLEFHSGIGCGKRPELYGRYSCD